MRILGTYSSSVILSQNKVIYPTRELQNENFLPTVGLEPTTSNLLHWCFNQLRHGTIFIVSINR